MQTNCTIKTVSSTIQNMRLINNPLLEHKQVTSLVTFITVGEFLTPSTPPALGLGEHRRGGEKKKRREFL